MKKQAISILLFLELLGFASSWSEAPFYPNGGISSPASDDGSSPLITLERCFIYFGRTYCKLFVNQNGHLTFDRPWGRYIPLKFPMKGHKDIIAPLWADLDNRQRGTVTYNQYTHGIVLQQATYDINQYFPQYQFEARWVFVATWSGVAFYPNVGDGSTFQVVLISNGPLSFVLMNYKSIFLTTLTVQAGYDTIKSAHYFSIPGSFTANATGPESLFCLSSNVNIPGRWAFRIDSELNDKILRRDGGAFWKDSSCKEKCTYSTSGLMCHNESCTFSQVCVYVEENHFICQPVQRGTCITTSDPHYKTFDGIWHHFQGTCTYVLSQRCHSNLPYYRVEGSNEQRSGTHVSWTRLVKVFVYNETIELVKGHRGEAKVNGEFRTTPFYLNNGTVYVHTSGFSVVVTTVFGLEVSYDTSHYVKIQVPSSYQNATCGLCGNFNNDPDDDFKTPEGEVVTAEVFGNSWKVKDTDEPECEDGCEGPGCGDCTEDQIVFLSGDDLCGILLDTNGPFAACHQVVSPEIFVENCVYDLCLEGGQEPNVCPSLEAYSRQCQQEGVHLQSWRRPDFCGIHCSANSHFEPQGTACPATCVDPYSPLDCDQPSLESCICDEGYVLSGDSCVPLEECGCIVEGYYYSSGESVVLGQDCGKVCDCCSGNLTCHSNICGPNEQCKVHNGKRGCYSSDTCFFEGKHIRRGVSFWTDTDCTEKCTCTSSGLTCHNESCTVSQVCESTEQDYFTCQSIKKGTCTIIGDPHYETFDGIWHHFQGTCTYVLSQQCHSDLPYYRVEGSNEHRGSTRVSWTRLVKVFVYNETIELVKGHRGEAKVNGVFRTTPFYLNNGTVYVHTSGFSVVVTTVFGLEVSYDTSHYVKIQVPSSYQNATCGLCGNFNNDPDDDFKTPEGEVVTAEVFGNSWKVEEADEPECEDGCEGPGCGDCTEDQIVFFSGDDLCGILLDRNGPFAACHQVVSPEIFVENCVYDLCLEGGQEPNVCPSLEAYSRQCQQEGVHLQSWRRPDFCGIQCSTNSHLAQQGTACPATCVDPYSPLDCDQPSLESCICDEGYVLSGDSCVPLEECGCIVEGYYYSSGQSVVLGQDCGKVCNCSSGNLTCHSNICGPNEQCKVHNGKRGCYSSDTCLFKGQHIQQGVSFWTDTDCTEKCTCTSSGLTCHNESCTVSQVCESTEQDYFTCQFIKKGTCTISGDPHYETFDGIWHHFQGTCTYVLSQQCHSDLPYYRVEGSNEHRGSTRVSWTRLVKVFVYNETIELVKGHRGEAKVNGVFRTTPFYLNNGTVYVHTSGFSVVVTTVFGLEVSYDTSHYVKIQVPSSYQNATCGLCGNFNNDPDDDFKTPEGEVVTAEVFGNSWKVEEADEPECEDGCEGPGCGDCTEDQIVFFSGDDLCGILLDRNGPFAACHQVVSPEIFVENCVYDLCLEGGQEPNVCPSLEAYSRQCQQEGVHLQSWRRPDFCGIQCSANSHLEQQGTACPATCVDPYSPLDCDQPSLESCICDEGYVLSGDSCVPLEECGCIVEGYYYSSGQSVVLGQDCGKVCNCSSGNLTCHSNICGPNEQCKVHNGKRGCYSSDTCLFKGQHIQQGVSFWTDTDCTKKCTCTSSGLTCHNESCTVSQVCESTEQDYFTCQSIKRGTCTIIGDPHYETFDGIWHHFQGTCTYVLSQQCHSDLPYYRVEGSNEHRGSTRVSWTRLVKVFVYNETIELVKGHRGEAKVNGVFRTTPFYLNNGTVYVHTSGFSVVVTTVFGLEVSYDTSHYVKIQVPSSYQNATCGLCGNFNNDPDDDFKTPEGEVVPAEVFGNSWKVEEADEPECEDGCEGPGCGDCTEDQIVFLSGDDLCGILLDRNGPFAACHQVVSPEIFVENCVYDLCLEGGQEPNVCPSLEAYSRQCQQEGVHLQSWRRPDFCGIQCSANSHLEQQGTACPATCVDPYSPLDCDQPSLESCICDEGYVLSGDSCVPLEECGCIVEGYYYSSGQSVVLGQDCGKVCNCSSGNLTCHSNICGPNEQCKVHNGKRGCYSSDTCLFKGQHIQQGVSFWTDTDCTEKCTCTSSGLTCHNESCTVSEVCESTEQDYFTCQSIKKGTCTISGDPHYETFDGIWHHFQGTCTYVLSQQCHSDMPNYRVEGSNEHRGSTRVSWTRLVKVFVYNETIELVKGHRGEAKVNGVFRTTPFYLNNGTVYVHTSGFSVVVTTVFGLEVSYDTSHYVKIQVPSSYQNATCGLCGNFNNDPDDDFKTPEGEVVTAEVFGNSWKVEEADEPECEDGCEGPGCGDCTEDQIVFFSGDDLCGILLDRNGPFAACHQVVSPEIFVENCVYDLCLEGGQEPNVCPSLEAYSRQCQQEGVHLQSWRRPDFCGIQCSANSHLEQQGTACPATCVHPYSPLDCDQPSLESCICDEGYVLSGDSCVPLEECGCIVEGYYYSSGQSVVLGQDCGKVCNCSSGNLTCHSNICGPNEQCKVHNGKRGCYSSDTCLFKGQHIQQGVSFWTDTDCTKKCTCTSSGLTCHNESCTVSQVCESTEQDYFTCQSIKRGTCTIIGDPHYETFDGIWHHFQGTCTYVLSQQCHSDLPYYRVEGSNEHRGSTRVSWTRLVKVFVYNETIELVKGHRGEAKVNGVFRTTPFYLNNGTVYVHTSGFSVVVTTVFGLEVSYDTSHYVKIQVPSSYQNATCGLCGNFNNDPDDDFKTPEGEVVPAEVFGNSWKVEEADEPECEDGCEGPGCGDCTEDQIVFLSGDDLCGILLDRNGPFAACHQVVSPEIFVENCVYDLCLEGGQEPNVCPSLEAYSRQCQQEGVHLQSWRRPDFCGIQCSANSHLEQQGTACPATCVDPYSPLDCDQPSLESCICDEGYVLSGDSCVPLEECGCIVEGYYYSSGQSVVLGQDCGKVCNCSSGNLTCHSNICGPNEQCKVHNGKRGCYSSDTCLFKGQHIQQGVSFWTDTDCTEKCTCTSSGLTCHNESCTVSEVCESTEQDYFTCQSIKKGTCTISGDPHYETFDGIWHHFQGTCTYVLSQQCHSDMPNYRVEGSNEHRGSTRVSWTRLVKVFVYNETIELVKGHRGEAKVNGVFRTTPFYLNNGTVYVHTSGFSVVVTTVFGLEVSYDTSHYVKIQVPSSYQNATCGLCGNFNNDPDDDFKTPEGEVVTAEVFGNSWKVEEADEPECEDGCEGPGCGDCTEDQIVFFSGDDLCGILLDRNGPFAACHQVVSPEIFVENCVYDLCLEGGQEPNVCPSLEAYSRQCQQEGVHLQSWRRPDFCGIHCSANSHLEQQGTACPATCVDPYSPLDCDQPSLESCICDEGYVLSGDSCVPLEECGCIVEGYYYSSGQSVVLGQDCGKVCNCSSGNLTCHSNICGPNEQCKVHNGKRGCYSSDTCLFKGQHIQQGVSFWTDTDCTEKCTCTSSGLTCHNESCTVSEVCESTEQDYFTCQSIKKGTCTISGDPHYETFDGIWHHFQGTCTYVLSQQCHSDMPNYRVEGSNEHRGSTRVSWTRLVKVFVYNETIELVKGHRGEAKVNGVFRTTPFYLNNGTVYVHTSGFSVVVTTVFGLEVSYDTSHYVKIQVPSSYQNATCGLCGNFNNDPDDDFKTPEGEVVTAEVFGNSWKVEEADEPECEDGCEGPGCGDCTEDQIVFFSGDDLCGILLDRNGPFAACHQVVSPEIFVENCVYDLCLEGGQEPNVCPSLEAYSRQCQQEGVHLQSWRRPDFCGIQCSANSHLEQQGTACPATCVDPYSPLDCDQPSLESCICDEGYVLSGDSCVPLEECGCIVEGYYYSSGQSVVLGQDCGKVCNCSSGNLTCHSNICGPNEQCKVHNGKRGCYSSDTCLFKGQHIQQGVSFWTDTECTKKCTCTSSGLTCHNESCTVSQVCESTEQDYFTCQSIKRGTCTIIGDPHYETFDGIWHHFQGTCTYVLSQQCHSDLPYYRVEGSNEHRGSTRVSWTRLVKVFVYNETIELVKGHRGEAKVNGVFRTTPFYLNNGTVYVHTSGFSVVVTTVFGLEVSYDTSHYVKIQVPSSYQNATCGLCGNFNNDPDDDFKTPEGEVVTAEVFGNSWKVEEADEPECEDGCEGPGCGDCTEDQIVFLSGDDLCGILLDRNGPFAACHQVVSPEIFVENCVYDLCLEGGQEPNVCPSLEAYSRQCQQEGVHLQSWRRPDFCGIHCSANSHLEQQGTACPATCVDPYSPLDCDQPSLESCICDEGYVLSGDSCVPLEECGCIVEGYYYSSGQSVVLGQDCGKVCNCSSGNLTCHSNICGPNEQCKVHNGKRGCYSSDTCLFKGQHIQQGVSFWTDTDCTEKCTCTSSGLTCHNESCTVSEVCESTEQDYFTCQSIKKGTCTISGDPHYETFDGIWHHFQGTCTYVLSQQCHSDLPYYRVEGSNEHRGSTRVSWTRLVKVFVYNETIELVKGHRGEAKVNGVFRTTPFYLNNGTVYVHTSGFSVVVTTVFGLEVSYDTSHYVKIQVPSSYQNATCGLCGNFNNDPDDDFKTPEGEVVTAEVFGNSWKVEEADEPECEDGCEGPGCGDCTEDQIVFFSGDDLCGILLDRNGPFAACHQVVSPEIFVENCVYDLCLEGGQEPNVCPSLEAYSRQCQQEGVHLQSWRRPDFCGIHCSANSHLEQQGTACPATCVDPYSPLDCDQPSLESCICDEGYVLSGDSCVPLEECGCIVEGYYYSSGQSVVLGQDCGKVCNCSSGNLTCHSNICGPNEQCKVHNGKRGCYSSDTCLFKGQHIQQGVSFWTDTDCTEKCTCTSSGLTCHNESCTVSEVCESTEQDYFTCQSIKKGTCTISGDPHYETFDGIWHHFQGTCTYVLSQQCHSDLPYYRVEGSNEHRGSTRVSWTRLVKVFVYNETIELVKGHRGEAKVNGVFRTTPFYLNNGTVYVHTSGFSVVVTTVFGLEVSYDTSHYVKIQVPSSYQNATCGLCGNFNNDPDDDFKTPEGEVVTAEVFGNSWKVEEADEPECEDGCEGPGCGDCTEDQIVFFSGDDLCGILLDRNGPFAACHQVVSPEIFVENCVYDLCLEGGQEPNVCPSLEAYSRQCQQEGVHLQSWRRPDFCGIQCSANSHLEQQGTACPATCVDPYSPLDCDQPSLESCICDEGYVLSGDSCVPLEECGCIVEGYYYSSGQSVVLGQDCGKVCNCSSGNLTCHSNICGPNEQCKVHNGKRGCYSSDTCLFKGQHIQQGVSFWTDTDCTEKCTCTSSGLTCHNESCTVSEVCESTEQDYFTCQSIKKGTCTISGDPHYETFDGIWHHFQGTCTYVLSQQCHSDMPNYRVEGSNEHRGSTRVSWTRLVKVFVYNETIELVKGHRGEAKVNGVFRTTPFYLNNGTVYVHTSGFSVVVTTVFGLEVSYDTSHYVKIQVPSSYQNATCGLCGNFNNDPDDDFKTPEGEVVTAEVFGNSWKVEEADEPECEDGCEGPGCGDCTEDQIVFFSGDDLCGILLDRNGPFAACHQVVSPEIFVENCVYDLCLEGGQEPNVCPSLEAYSRQCQQEGVHLQSWRRPDFCGIQCSANSHLEQQGTACPATCVDPYSPLDCDQPSLESCICDEGYVLSGDSCVPLEECGCIVEGYYYSSGQSVVLGQDCGKVCNCSSGDLTCHSNICGPNEQCKVHNGKRGCRPINSSGTCSASGDPHYLTFDQTPYDFQGTCRYVLATVCDYSLGLNNFSVESKNEALPGLTVSVTSEVYVIVSGFEILLTRQRNSEIMVNGIWRHKPLQVLGNVLSIYASGHQTVLETNFGLSVSFDGQSRVSISVPSNYSGKTCGLCGNFNGDPADDFQTPSGLTVMSPSDFGTSWKVPGDYSCSDGCGSSCPQCPDDRKAQAHCEIINAAKGPFSMCHQHVDPVPYFNNCVFDVCIGGVEILCSSIQAYASSCQAVSVHIYHWRQNTFCDMACPAHSHYELCGADCGRTCASVTDVTCERACSEGCFCDEGFVRSGTKCVTEEKCGCQHDGAYYNSGETFWTEECSQRCVCSAPNNLTCVDTTCSPQQECTIRDGHLGCFEVLDPCAELKCTEDERCVEKEGSYGCFCNENNVQNRDSFDASVTCVSSSGTVSLSRCQLTEAGFHHSALHLRDSSCKGSLQNGRLVFSFNYDDQFCGTTLKSNGSHFIYENVILGERSTNIQLFFSCVFPLTSAQSMDIAINPVESAIKKELPSGQGSYRVRLIPYLDARFENPLSASTEIQLNQDERLFIEVQTEGVDQRQMATVMDSCWATPVNDADYSLRQDLILRGCPADESVAVIQNGDSTVGRFSFESFSFEKFDSIYLHCHVHLCPLDFNNCAVRCNVRSRGRRDVSYHDSVLLSLGLIVPKEQTN